MRQVISYLAVSRLGREQRLPSEVLATVSNYSSRCIDCTNM